MAEESNLSPATLMDMVAAERKHYAAVPGDDWLWAKGTSESGVEFISIAVAPIRPDDVTNPKLVALVQPIQLEPAVMQHIIHLHNNYPALLTMIAHMQAKVSELEDGLEAVEAALDEYDPRCDKCKKRGDAHPFDCPYSQFL